MRGGLAVNGRSSSARVPKMCPSRPPSARRRRRTVAPGQFPRLLLLLLLVGAASGQERHDQSPALGNRGTKCYDAFGVAQRCIPEFGNAAFNVLMDATNTCGDDGDIKFCVQTGPSSTKKICQVCRAGDHEPLYLTDFHSQDNQTWWQSETMFEGIQFPMQVNLTLNFRKAYDITYVRLVFYSPRPESFSIYKRTSEDGPWLPYQFYSATCRDTYGLPDTQHAEHGEETRPLCTSEYSDISPVRGGNVPFSTLEGRPGATHFDTNPALQEWVTATDIRISLDRLNTFGDEHFGAEQVLRSYFFAIADVAVGARCTCNGHAAECVNSTGESGASRRVCRCEHYTAGPDCGECLPFFNDAPWKRASEANANECKPCNCHGFSNRCIFDEGLYNKTGHGGYCLECTANRDGPNCEQCRENYYQREDSYCMPCECSAVGSRSLQCNREGRCQCKPGVTGDKCDRCAINHYDFGSHGCKPCGCSEAGSRGNTASCHNETGVCMCKDNVEGKRCRECKPGYFNLDLDNEFGCTPCFCYGHSSVCDTAPGYSKITTYSYFDRSNERWSGQDEQHNPIEVSYNGKVQSIGVSAPDRRPVYFIAPDRFLGDQRASYNRDLQFTLRIGEKGPSPTAADIFLEGSGTYVTNTIFGQGNALPAIYNQEFKFRLHEHPDYGWQPRLSARAFMSILTNLTAIRIRGTYTPRGVGFLDNVKMETAHGGAAGEPANWIERCDCPVGYIGQFCESCAPGFRHSPARGGPFKQCELCDCNKHAVYCEAETGECICEHNTAGDNCDVCKKGYYGNALQKTEYDCKPCGCPNNGPCMVMPDETLVCLECPTGYAGPRCDLCSDGYFGDPVGRHGTVRACLPCACNHNIDQNAVGNCNRTTGECLKCIHYTAGIHCDQCLPGFYGNALAVPKGDCKRCECYHAGTRESDEGPPLCDQLSGQCSCKPHVQGRNCDQCEDGYFSLDSGDGCQHCNCNPVGSYNHTCNIQNGQCFCRPGVTGLRCDKCEVNKYGFSRDGCKSCDCDPIGSGGLQCDTVGQCPCLTNVEGRKCDRCKENKFDRKQGCIDCPPCYNLVQDAVHEHHAKLMDLEKLLNDIESGPIINIDDDFEDKLNEVHKRVDDLLVEAKTGAGRGGLSLTEHLTAITDRIRALDERLVAINQLSAKVQKDTSIIEHKISEADLVAGIAKQLLDDAQSHLNIKGADALSKAVNKSQEFGHQNEQMKKIAHEARERAEELEKQTKNIVDLAAQAYNASFQAYDVAKNTLDKQINISDSSVSLRNVIVAAADKFEDTTILTKETQALAHELHKEALELFQEISTVSIPIVNVKQLKNQAQWQTEEADAIIDKMDQMREENIDTNDGINDLVANAQDLYKKADEQQQLLDELLMDADVARAQAQSAVSLGNKTLNEATDTLDTLQHFNNQVSDSRDAAAEALLDVSDIKELINHAENNTAIASDALIGAEKNAQSARDTAQEAQSKHADQASLEAQAILAEADKTRQKASDLRVEANDFAERVAVTSNTMKQLEDQAVNDNSLITESRKKVGQAESDSAEASTSVEKAMQEVQQIIDILKDLPSISTNELDVLEHKMQLAEAECQDANLENRIQEVSAEKRKQAILIEHYETEVKRLTNEVENIREISESLPNGCFKRTKLEP